MKRSTFAFTRLAGTVILPFSLMACGGGKTMEPPVEGGCTPGAGANTAKYVVSSVTVPADHSYYAIDLNGDARTDNQLGNIVEALSQQGLKVQDGVSTALAAGQLVILATETSSDAAFQTDSCAGVKLQLGNPTTNPDFTGNGTFTGGGDQSDVFAGPIAGGKFNSGSPVTATDPVNVTIALPLVPGAEPVVLKITAAHLTFTRDASGMVKEAQLQGAIEQKNITSDIIPNVAKLLTGRINDPAMQNSTSDDIKKLFDNGGTMGDAACPDMLNGKMINACKNPDGSCSHVADKKIDICEVSTSNVIRQVLAPDVQMFDNGVYKPNKANTMKDSLSLGLSFTMAPAKF